MKNQKRLKSTVLIAPATITAAATATANFDCKDVGDVEIIVSLGALAGAGVAPASIKILESDLAMARIALALAESLKIEPTKGEEQK